VATGTETIGDEDELLRRLHQSAVKNGRVTSGAFKTGDQYDQRISVILGRMSSIENARRTRPTFGVGMFKARVPRSEGFCVIHIPKEDEPAHCECQGDNNREKSHRMALQMQVVAELNGHNS